MKYHARFGFGISSILTIFVIMCLVTFAVLSYTSAHADASMSDNILNGTVAYYEADSLANEHISDIDAALEKLYRASASDKTVYEATARNWFSENTKDTVSEAKGTGLFSVNFTESVDETRTLSVTLEILWPNESEPWYYKITGWVTDNTADWTPDHSLNLAGG